MADLTPEALAAEPAPTPNLRGRVKQIAATLRQEADGIDDDPLLNRHVRHADAEAKRAAAAHLDVAIAADNATRARPLSAGFDDALATLRRLAGAAAPSRAARVRGAVAESERLIRAAMNDEPPPAHTAMAGQLRDALADLADAEALAANWPKCPDGCGCRLGTDDADASECGCDGPCTMECRENGYPDASSYRDLAVRHAMDQADCYRAALEDVVRGHPLCGCEVAREALEGGHG